MEKDALRDRLRAIDIRIGRNVKAIRRARRMTQADLGGALGVTFQQIQKYERGINRMPASRLVQIADLLGVSPHDVLGYGSKPQWSRQVWDAIGVMQAFDSDHSRRLWLELGRILARDEVVKG